MKTALVTGSSRGIGAAIAEELVADGWNVILHFSRCADEAFALAERLENSCHGAIQADLNSSDDTFRLWNEARRMAKIDALVNNAGIYEQARFGDLNAQEVQKRMFRVNFEAPVELISSALSEFTDRGEGKVLNVASRVGFRGEPGAAMYAASKAALINLTRSLAVEYAATGIGFFGIAPGWVNTSMARDGMESRQSEILAGIPAGRMASPADCAHAAKFLLADESAYLTGTVLDINGASYFH